MKKINNKKLRPSIIDILGYMVFWIAVSGPMIMLYRSGAIDWIYYELMILAYMTTTIIAIEVWNE